MKNEQNTFDVASCQILFYGEIRLVSLTMEEFSLTPPEIVEAAEILSSNLLPEKSRKHYEEVYKKFMDWRISKRANSFSETVLMAYFGELSDKYKSSSLWAKYSMLRSTLLIRHNINIENYSKLKSFLKRKSEGYRPKKAKTFSPDEINKFINEAPDTIYLATKVRK